MSPDFQAVGALLIVAAAATWLVARSFAKGRRPGCGGDCGCAAEDLRSRARDRERAAKTHG